MPEVLRQGSDVTVVTYGACCAIALDAAKSLQDLGVSCEVIDVQTLNPFDIDHMIVGPLERTHAVLFLDEDMPGGASAFMMQQVLEVQQGWWHLDCAQRTLAASQVVLPHRVDSGLPAADIAAKKNFQPELVLKHRPRAHIHRPQIVLAERLWSGQFQDWPAEAQEVGQAQNDEASRLGELDMLADHRKWIREVLDEAQRVHEVEPRQVGQVACQSVAA